MELSGFVRGFMYDKWKHKHPVLAHYGEVCDGGYHWHWLLFFRRYMVYVAWYE